MKEKKMFDAVALIDAVPANIATTSGNVTTIQGLPPIIAPNMRVKSVTEVTGAAEVTQKLYITLAATVAADTTYAIGIKFQDELYEKQNAEVQRIAYTSPSALTGTAALDKHNVYVSLANKINGLSRFKKYCTAYAVFTLPWSAQTANFTNGNVVVGGTSGARGLILSQSDSGATGTLTLAAITGYASVFTNGEALTEVTTAGVAATGDGTAGTQVSGVRLQIDDRAGYYPINGFRGGKTMVYALSKFVTSDIVVNTAAVYAKFTGAQLLKQIPVKEYLSDNLVSGYADHNNLSTTANAPTSGNTYNLVIVEVEELTVTTGMNEAGGIQGSVTRTYGLYLNSGDGDYAAALADIQGLV